MFGLRSSCAFETVNADAPNKSADESVNALSWCLEKLNFILCLLVGRFRVCCRRLETGEPI